jgi:hypothetical protein
VQNTVNWMLPLLEMQPLEITGMEPVLSSAQLVLSTLLGPPLVWPWNRSVLPFTTANQDYAAILPDFSFLEGGTVQPQTGGKSWELTVKLLLHSDQSSARPQYIGPLLDDGQGNITFRFSPSPDQSYNAKLIYQRNAPRIQSLAATWAPVPDDMSYMPMWGLLAMMSLIGNDARFNEYNTKFVTAVLGAQGGLTDLERNIFIGNWMRVASQITSTQMATQERFKAREQ